MLRGIRRGGLIGGLVRPGLAPTCALPSLSTSVPSAPSAWFCWPGLAPAGEALFFASPKKSTQKKGDPQSGSLRCATGNLRCSTAEGVWLNSLRCASLKQRQPLSLLRLRCSAQPGRGNRNRGSNTQYQYRTPNANKDTPWRVLVFFGIRGSVFGCLVFLLPPLVDAPRSAGPDGSGIALSERSAAERV